MGQTRGAGTGGILLWGCIYESGSETERESDRDIVGMFQEKRVILISSPHQKRVLHFSRNYGIIFLWLSPMDLTRFGNKSLYLDCQKVQNIILTLFALESFLTCSGDSPIIQKAIPFYFKKLQHHYMEM